jgi:hypothetical protein
MGGWGIRKDGTHGLEIISFNILCNLMQFPVVQQHQFGVLPPTIQNRADHPYPERLQI